MKSLASWEEGTGDNLVGMTHVVFQDIEQEYVCKASQLELGNMTAKSISKQNKQN